MEGVTSYDKLTEYIQKVIEGQLLYVITGSYAWYDTP